MKKETLSDQLESALIRERTAIDKREDWAQRALKAERELSAIQDQRRMELSNKYEELSNLARQQFEIIRWLANPETAKDPFNQSKSNRLNGNY